MMSAIDPAASDAETPLPLGILFFFTDPGPAAAAATPGGSSGRDDLSDARARGGMDAETEGQDDDGGAGGHAREI
jgi:hypothetical protein